MKRPSAKVMSFSVRHGAKFGSAASVDASSIAPEKLEQPPPPKSPPKIDAPAVIAAEIQPRLPSDELKYASL